MDNFQSVIGNVPSIQDILDVPAPNVSTPAQQGTGLVGSALSSGVRGLISSTARGVGTAADFVGATGFAKSAQDYADQQRALATQDQNPAYENAPWYSPGGFAYKALQGLPTMAGAAAGAALAVPAAVAAGAIAPEAAGALTVGGIAARALGGAAALYPSVVGENAQRAQDEGQPVNDAKALALGVPGALVAGAFPAYGEAALGKGLLQAGMSTTKKVLTGAAIGGGINATAGAAGEALMQQMGDPNRSFASRAQDILNAGLTGGLQGAAFGGVIHGFAKDAPNSITNDNLLRATDLALPSPGPAQLENPIKGALAPPDPNRAGLIEPPQRGFQSPDPALGQTPPGVIVPPAQPGQAIRQLTGPNDTRPEASGVITPPAPPLVGEPVDTSPRQLPPPEERVSRPVSGQAIPLGQVLRGEPVDTSTKQLPPPVEPPASGERVSRPASDDEPVITPPPAEEQPLRASFNKDLINTVDKYGADSVDGKPAFEELMRRVPPGTPKAQVEATLQQQDTDKTKALTVQANKAILNNVDTPQRMGAFNHTKLPPEMLADTNALKAHIYDTAVARDKNGTLSPNMLKTAKAFGMFDENGRLVDPRPQTEIDPGTPDVAALANEPQDDAPNRPDVPAGSPYADEHAAMDGIRRNLPDSLDPDTRTALMSKLDQAQAIMSAESPGKGQISKARALAKSVQNAVEAQKTLDQAAGRPTTATKAPVVDTTKGATKFDVPPDKVVAQSRPFTTEPAPNPEPAPNKALTSGLSGPLKALRSNIMELGQQKLEPKTRTVQGVEKPESKRSLTARQGEYNKGVNELADQHDELLKAAKTGDLKTIRAVEDDHFSTKLADDNVEGVHGDSPKIKDLLDKNASTINNVLDAVKEIKGENKLDPRLATPFASRTLTDRDIDLTHHIANNMSVRDILKDIVQNGSTSLRKTIAARLLETKIDPTIRFGTTQEMQGEHPNDVFGDYHRGFDRIRVYDQSDLEHTILHEATHAATIKGLNDPALRAKVQGLMDAASKLMTPEEREHQSMHNPEEFLAEAQSNSQFQQFLGGLRPDGSKLSIWDHIKNTVRDFFGLPKGSESLLDQTLSASGEVMDNMDAMREQSAPGLEKTTRLYARTVQENADRLLKMVTEPSLGDKYSRLYQKTLGWRALDAIAQGVRNIVPSYTKYADSIRTKEAFQDKMNAPGVLTSLLRRKNPVDVQKAHDRLKTYSVLGIDPRKTEAQHTWLDDGRKDELSKDIKDANNLYNTLKRKGQSASYDSDISVNEMHQAAAITSIGIKVAKLSLFEDKLNLGADPEALYRNDTSGMHQSPARAAEFWKGQATRIQGLLAKHVADTQRVMDGELDPVRQRALKAQIEVASSAERDMARDIAGMSHEPNFSVRRQGKYYVSGKMIEGFDATHIAKLQDIMDKAGFGDAVLQSGNTNRDIYVRTENADQAQALANAFEKVKGSLLDSREAVGRGAGSEMMSLNPGLLPVHIEAIIRNIDANHSALPDGMDDGTKQSIKAARVAAKADLTSQLLDMLPDSAKSKVWAKRENVQGYNADMGNASDHRYQNSARAIANMFHNSDLSANLRNMSAEVQDANRTAGTDVNKNFRAASAVHEALLRDAQRNVNVPRSLFDGVRQWTHLLEIGISPKYTATLATQVLTLALPELAKTHGYAASAKALVTNMPKALKIMKMVYAGVDKNHFTMTADKLAGLSPKDRDFMLTQNNRGSFNLASYTNAMYENLHIQNKALRAVHDYAGAWTLNSEMFPRLVTALAARDLYEARPVKAGSDYNDLHSFVANKVNNSQLDWTGVLSPRNTGRHGVAGAASPMLAQFQGYHMKIMEKLVRETTDAFGARGPEYTAGARKFMLGHLAAMTAVSGTMGLPGVNMAAGIYDRLADWATGNDTHDIRASYRQYLSNVFGSEMGEALAHGVPRFAGIDLSKDGEDRIIPMSDLVASKQKLEDASADWAKQMLGPTANMGIRTMLGIRDLTNGDYLEAMTKMPSELIGKGAEGIKLATRGYTDKAGFKFGAPPSTGEIVQKLMGFDPPAEANYEEKNRVAQGLDERNQFDRANIMTHLARAVNTGDKDEFKTWSGAASQYTMNHIGEMPPMVEFANFMRTHAQSAAIAQSTGLPLGVKIRDLSTRQRLNYGNMNQ